MNERAVVALRRWTVFEDVGRLVAECLADLGGIERFVRPGQTVVIKPNIVGDLAPSTGGTAHWELVEALVEHVQRCRPGRIVLAEGTPNFGTTLETAFPTGGWRDLAARRGLELYNLDGGPHAEIRLERPRYPRAIPFSQLILDADVFISVPCLKTHISLDYTVALKNSYALTPQWKRSEIHAQYLLEEALVDINRIRKPDLILVDGWEGAEGYAGGIGDKHPAGARLMLAGDDPVAVDTVAKELMGLTAPTRYLNWAAEEGLGINDWARIQITGATLDECRHPFLPPFGELKELMPDVVVHDQCACSGCRSAAIAALNRFSAQKLLKPVHVVFGKTGDVSEVGEYTLVLGNCAARYRELGHYFEGCPAKVPELIEGLRALGCICQQCYTLATGLVSAFPEAFRADLRVTAAGQEAWVGSQVKRDAWHLELLVGDCMARYAHAVQERAVQFGLDPARDIRWLRGCPAEGRALGADELRAALTRLRQVWETVRA